MPELAEFQKAHAAAFEQERARVLQEFEKESAGIREEHTSDAHVQRVLFLKASKFKNIYYKQVRRRICVCTDQYARNNGTTRHIHVWPRTQVGAAGCGGRVWAGGRPYTPPPTFVCHLVLRSLFLERTVNSMIINAQDVCIAGTCKCMRFMYSCLSHVFPSCPTLPPPVQDSACVCGHAQPPSSISHMSHTPCPRVRTPA